jgi:hypothetical protein
LQKEVEKSGRTLIMTSFNGDYVGYVSHSKHYFKKTHPEIKDMNWLGCDAFEFFEEISKKILSHKFLQKDAKKTP